MNVDQDLFSAYAFYAGVVTLKMLVMSFLTARQRFANGVFISSEDIKGHEKEYKVLTTLSGHFRETFLRQAGQGLNENVERVRRAHQNDIENILPFLILGFLYMFTNPAYATALLCYRCVCHLSHSSSQHY